MFTIIDACVILSVTIIATTPIYLILWFIYKKYNLYEFNFVQASKILVTSAIKLRTQNTSGGFSQKEVIMEGITSVVSCFQSHQNKQFVDNIHLIRWVNDIADILVDSLDSCDFSKSINAFYKVFNVLSDGQI